MRAILIRSFALVVTASAAAALATACSKSPAAAPAEVAAKPAAAPSAAAAAPASAPPQLAHPLEVGSQAAKDQLYCSGLIFSTYATTGGALSPTEEAIRMKNQALGMVIGQAGADKLMAEGVARVTQLGAISDAYTDLAASDIAKRQTRLKIADCMKQAAALPTTP